MPPPETQEIALLLGRIKRRVFALLNKGDSEDIDEQDLAILKDQERALFSQQLSLQPDSTSKARCVFDEGFSLHADLEAHQNDRKTLERLLRYGMRPPFSKKRLFFTPSGKVRLKLRKPSYTGQTEVIFEPHDFLRRIIATVPPLRMNMVRFHGVFAPNAKVRSQLGALLPEPLSYGDAHEMKNLDDDEEDKVKKRGKGKSKIPHEYRRPWQELLKRVFDINLTCGLCGRRMKRISHIEQPILVKHILGHLGVPTQAPKLSPARASPQDNFEFYDEPYALDT